ncbi:AlpA family phage regulatory protein [Hoeflea poritis]|uniref:AlpA family phage regulatory protein n=1 Tax=Hoeflea poritis TaxID=2993659 RepID=UPI003CCDEDF0
MAQHIARLEAVGQFPKRVPLGPNRVAWIEGEVLESIQEDWIAEEAPKPLLKWSVDGRVGGPGHPFRHRKPVR